MIRNLAFVLAISVLASSGTAAAQTAESQPAAKTPMWKNAFAQRLARVKEIRKTAGLNTAEQIEAEVDVQASPQPFLLFAHAQSLTANLREIEGARTDKQLGAPPATGGSTTLVSKGAVPRILAFAVEHGAATQTSDETSATVRGNAVGWLDLIRGHDVLSGTGPSAVERYLRKLSYSVTFNLLPAAPATTEERPDPEEIEEQDNAKQQVTAYSFRVSLIDQRDPRRADNRASGQALLGGTDASRVLQELTIIQTVINSPLYREWLTQTKVELSAPGQLSDEDLERILYARLEGLRQIMIREIPGFDRGVARFVSALRTYEDAQAAWFDQLQKRFVLAAELVRTRPPSEAGATTYRLIGEGRVGRTRLDLTINAGATYQDAGTALVPEPKDTEGWRDIQFGVQAELPLGGAASFLDEAAGTGRPALAFEYLSRKLLESAVVTFSGHDFSVEPGWIHAAQVKLTIPMKGSGVKIPLSLSVANRSELLKEKTVRGHIGLTFDLDVLTSAVRR